MVQEMRTVGLPAFRSFHTAARLGGIAAAADKLGMAKSGVSRHVAQLEAHFGVRLFERGSRSVKLTPVGARLSQRIQSILAEVDLLDEMAREESSGVAGQVTMAATPEFGGLLAANFFPVLRQKHPKLRLVMRTQYAFEDMQDPGTDIAFRVFGAMDDRLVARQLGAFHSALVASPGFAASHPVSAPIDLTTVPCVAFQVDRPVATWTLYGRGNKTTVEVSGPLAVRNFTILMELAIAGEGYALLPEFMLEEALARGTLVRCLPGYCSRPYPVFLTFRPGARQVARVNETIRLAEEFIPTLFRATQPLNSKGG